MQDIVTDVFDREETIAHAPDAVFALDDGAGPRLYFVEVDRKRALDVRSGRGIVHLLDFYESYWVSNEYQRYRSSLRLSGDLSGFHVLFLTPTKERTLQIVKLVGRQSFARRVESNTLVGDVPSVIEGDMAAYEWTSLRRTNGGTERLGHERSGVDRNPQITPLRPARSRAMPSESVGLQR